MKRFDLMQQINTRGTFLLTKTCAPHLRKSGQRPDPHALAAAQPGPKWLGPFPGYMLSKYGMTLLTLGFAAEFADARGERELPVAAHHDRDGRDDQPDPGGRRELAVGGHHGRRRGCDLHRPEAHAASA